jgi:hypothetical protein
VLFHDLLDDRQPDSGARFPRFFRFFRAVKLMKDLFDFFLVHADALVLDGNPYMALVLRAFTVTSVSLRRVFHRVSK